MMPQNNPFSKPLLFSSIRVFVLFEDIKKMKPLALLYFHSVDVEQAQLEKGLIQVKNKCLSFRLELPLNTLTN